MPKNRVTLLIFIGIFIFSFTINAMFPETHETHKNRFKQNLLANSIWRGTQQELLESLEKYSTAEYKLYEAQSEDSSVIQTKKAIKKGITKEFTTKAEFYLLLLKRFENKETKQIEQLLQDTRINMIIYITGYMSIYHIWASNNKLFQEVFEKIQGGSVAAYQAEKLKQCWQAIKTYLQEIQLLEIKGNPEPSSESDILDTIVSTLATQALPAALNTVTNQASDVFMLPVLHAHIPDELKQSYAAQIEATMQFKYHQLQLIAKNFDCTSLMWQLETAATTQSVISNIVRLSNQISQVIEGLPALLDEEDEDELYIDQFDQQDSDFCKQIMQSAPAAISELITLKDTQLKELEASWLDYIESQEELSIIPTLASPLCKVIDLHTQILKQLLILVQDGQTDKQLSYLPFNYKKVSPSELQTFLDGLKRDRKDIKIALKALKASGPLPLDLISKILND